MFGRGRRAENFRSDGLVKKRGGVAGGGGGSAAALWDAGVEDVEAGIGSRRAAGALTSFDGSEGAVERSRFPARESRVWRVCRSVGSGTRVRGPGRRPGGGGDGGALSSRSCIGSSASSSMNAGLILAMETSSVPRPGMWILNADAERDATRKGPSYGEARVG